MTGLPETWRSTTVADVCEMRNGHGFGPKDWDSAGLPIIRIQNLNGGQKFDYFSGVPDERWLVDPGQMLFSWAGTKGVSFGPTIWRGTRGVLNQHIFKVQAKSGIDGEWLYWALKHVTDRIETQSHGFKSTLVHVKKSDINRQQITVPPLSEQRRIARVLSTWDQAIATTERLLANSRGQKQTLMTMLTGGIRRFGTSLAAWRTFKLGDLGAVYGGLSGKSGEDFGMGSTFIPYVNVFNNYRIDLAALGLVKVAPDEKQSRVQFGDVLFTTSSETPNEVGMAAVLLDEVEELFLNSFCFGYRLHDFGTLLPEYAGYVMRSPAIRSQMTQLAQGSTRFNISMRK